MSGKVRYAKDYICNVPKCGKKAVVFVGLNDPDGTEYPKCRHHADQWHFEVMMALCDINYSDKFK